jgi:hypothetical protein
MRLLRCTVPVLAALIAAVGAHASSTPVGKLPPGPIASTTTRTGQLVAVALPHVRRSAGYSWRIARRYDARVVRQLSEADVGTSVVVLFRVVGRGDTSLVFALTRGDTSGKAVQAYTHRIHVR